MQEVANTFVFYDAFHSASCLSKNTGIAKELRKRTAAGG